MPTILETVIAAVRRNAIAQDGAVFETDTNLLENGILDSLGVVGLVADLEETIACSLEAADLDPKHFQTVEAIVRLVESKGCTVERSAGSNEELQGALVTGATGFVGSNLALQLLLEGRTRLFCLVRPSRNCQTRLEDAVRDAASAAGLTEQIEPFLGRLTAIPGDLGQPGAGLSAATWDTLRRARITELWHCAASLRFEAEHRAEIFDHNVGGTERILEIATSLRVREYNHVSTAYVAGKRRGAIPEGPYDRTYEPNNCYEESKRAAEDLVLAAQTRGEFRVRVFRPSIVIGNSTTFDSTSDSGLYGFARGLDRFREQIDEKVPGYVSRYPLRVLHEEGTTVDLIPVDILVREALALARDPEESGTFFHLTNPFTAGLPMVAAALGRAYPQVRYELVSNVAMLRPADSLFRSGLTFYNPYLQNDKRFERRRDHGTPPEHLRITVEHLERYLSAFFVRLEAIKAQTAKRRVQVLKSLEQRTVRSRFGDELTYYTRGNGPTVVLVNAFGVSHNFWQVVLPALGNYRVITWQCRGSIACSARQTPTVRDHADDLSEILDHEGVSEAHIVGWCTGPKVALEFYAGHPERVASLSFVTGSFGPIPGHEDLVTRYDQVIGKLARMVVRRPESADVFLRTLSSIFGNDVAPDVDQGSLVVDLMGMISPRFRGMIVGPFMSTEAIATYAGMVADFQQHDVSHILPALDVPTLVIGAEHDVIAHPDLSAVVAHRIPGAHALQLKNASHWCLMESGEEVSAALTTFLDRVATDPHARSARGTDIRHETSVATISTH